MTEITAVVVTYNRKKLLRGCIEAILTQSRQPDHILIIDNASTDGTKELITSDFENVSIIQYVRLEENTGGAGGFYEGIRLAYAQGSDWVWLMDDDTYPTPHCLEELIKGIQLLTERGKGKRIGFVSSAVFGSSGESMNVPEIDVSKDENGCPSWYTYLDGGIVRICNATFVSTLINAKAIKCCGLPCKDYFIWGDDIEYTTRISRFYGNGYFIGGSKAIHKRTIPKELSLDVETDKYRIQNLYYLVRNGYINRRYYKKNYVRVITFLIGVLYGFRCLFMRSGWKKMKVVLRGYFSGVLQYDKFKRYIDSQIADNK